MEYGKTYTGSRVAHGLRFALVASRFNEFVVDRLVAGARETLVQHGAEPGAIDLAWVPGAFELPMVAARMARSERYDAVIGLGAVIRGATPHFDLVAAQTARGIAQAGTDTGVPVLFGVLTCDTSEQAIERAGLKSGNKGAEAAAAAIEMVNLLRALG